MQHSPAQWVINTIGGVRATARAIGRDPSSISRWKQTGHVPTNAMRLVLRYAKQHRLDITPTDLVVGRKTKAKR